MYIAQTDSWYLERITVLIAGIIILTTVIFAWVHSPYWLILTYTSNCPWSGVSTIPSVDP